MVEEGKTLVEEEVGAEREAAVSDVKVVAEAEVVGSEQQLYLRRRPSP